MLRSKKKQKYKSVSLGNSMKKQSALFGVNRLHSQKKFHLSKSSEPVNVFYGTYIFLWTLFFGVVIYVLIFSPILRISSISIAGNVTIPSVEIEQFVQSSLSQYKQYVIPGNAFLFFEPLYLEKSLNAEFKKIQSVKIEKVFPDTLEISIQERAILLLWCVHESCYYINEEGYAYTPATFFNSEKEGKFLKVSDQSAQDIRMEVPVLSPDAVKFALNIQNELQEKIGIEIENESFTHSRFSDEFIFKTSEGWTLRINTRIPMEKSLSALKLLLEKEISKEKRERLKYIDLRTENKVYYSIEGEVILNPDITQTEDVEISEKKK